MLWMNLIQHVQTNRFDRSYSIFADAIETGQIDSIASAIEKSIESDPEIVIQIRDHVSFFLDCFPVYFSLEISSIEMLEIVSNVQTVVAAQITFFEKIKEMISTKDSRVAQYKLEIETMSSSIYSQLLPSVLENRKREIDYCRIPFSVVSVHGQTRTRYSVRELFKTAYGSQLLHALNIESSQPVIGKTIWSDISVSLIALGYEPDKLLVQIDESAWSVHVREQMMDFTKSNYTSKELLNLKKIHQAYAFLGSADQSKRISGLDFLSITYSRVCDDRLFSIARYGHKRERLRALDILIKSKRIDAEPVFLVALQEQDTEIRSRGAIGLSSLTSLEFARISKDIFNERISSVKRIVDKAVKKRNPMGLAILQAVVSSKNKMVRMESIHALVSFCTSDSEQILFNMVKDPEPLVRKELTKQTKHMRPDFAKVILKEVLNDESYLVRSTARKLAQDLWPDELWDLKES